VIINRVRSYQKPVLWSYGCYLNLVFKVDGLFEMLNAVLSC